MDYTLKELQLMKAAFVAGTNWKEKYKGQIKYVDSDGFMDYPNFTLYLFELYGVGKIPSDKLDALNKAKLSPLEMSKDDALKVNLNFIDPVLSGMSFDAIFINNNLADEWHLIPDLKLNWIKVKLDEADIFIRTCNSKKFPSFLSYKSNLEIHKQILNRTTFYNSVNDYLNGIL